MQMSFRVRGLDPLGVVTPHPLAWLTAKLTTSPSGRGEGGGNRDDGQGTEAPREAKGARNGCLTLRV